jgi:hypothetical protein
VWQQLLMVMAWVLMVEVATVMEVVCVLIVAQEVKDHPRVWCEVRVLELVH